MSSRTGDLTHEVSTDVLVIGGGLAAAAAALEAVKLGSKVTLVDKGRFACSGSSPTAGGGFQAWVPPELGGDPTDTKEQLFRDIVLTGHFLSNQRMAEIYADEATEELLALIKLGFPFLRRPDGKLMVGLHYATLGKESGKAFTPEARRTVVAVGSRGGQTMMQVLRKEALHRGVQVLENIMLTRLLSQDGEIVGAFGMDVRSGDYYRFQAKSTVLAAGSATRLSASTGVPYTTTGDAYALAYDAGGVFMNMEFITLKMNSMPKGMALSPGIGQIGGTGEAGRVHYNAVGQRFLERLEKGKQGVPPSSLSAHAMLACLREVKAGRGPLYSDYTHVSWDLSDEKVRHVYERLKAMGYDMTRERVQLGPPESHDYLGGLRINERGETNVPGLYSAGESAADGGGLCGAERRPGIAMGSCMVFGRRAGRYAAERARRSAHAPIPTTQVQEETDRIEALRGRQRVAKPRELEQAVRSFGGKVCGLRDDATLREAIGKFVGIREKEISGVAVSSPAELAQALEVQSLALSGEMVARAALLRTETRGVHLREDFPEQDDEHWLKWVLVTKDGAKMKVWSEPVPVATYKLKPEAVERQ